jgi:flagellum-specific ATP synthase
MADERSREEVVDMSEHGTASTRMQESVLEAIAAGGPEISGQVEGVRGLSVRVRGLSTRVGELVTIKARTNVSAEVVSVHSDGDQQLATCLPLGLVTGIGAGDRVVATGGPLRIRVGEELLGRVLDGLGRPLDGSQLPARMMRTTVDAAPPDAMTRDRVDEQLPLGVRVIDTLIPVGRGQRMGIFAGSGVGKSSLLSMIARGTQADVTVIALVGERGREVREFLEDNLGEEGLRRSVVVVATSDQPPMVRLRAAFVATRIAEWFRDSGRQVLFMMDSLTRLAAAQREIGLSAGEPPATRGYPPSVFAMLPQLLERAGASSVGGITGLYTVLVEGDDHNEPIADTARSILDGHIVLDRRLASAGHFPSIDVLQSVSRVAGAITTADQRRLLREARKLLDARADVRELVQIGAYVSGTNPVADRALALWPGLEGFLQQDLNQICGADDSWAALGDLLRTAPAVATLPPPAARTGAAA